MAVVRPDVIPCCPGGALAHASIDNEKIVMTDYAVGTVACNLETAEAVWYHGMMSWMRPFVDLELKGGSEVMAWTVKVDSPLKEANSCE